MSVNNKILKANTLFKKGQLGNALKIYNSILEQFPNNKRAREAVIKINQRQKQKFDIASNTPLLERIKNLYSQKMYTKIVQLLHEKMNEVGDSPELLNILGASYMSLGQYRDASVVFKNIVNIKPTDEAGYNNLGVSYKAQNNLQEAVISFQRSIELNSNFPEAYFNLATVYQLQQNTTLAIRFFEKAIKYKKDYFSAYNGLAISHNSLGNKNEAIDVYRNFIIKNKNFAEAYNNLGVLLEESGKHSEAVQSYNIAISKSRGYTDPCYNLANYLYKNNELLQAKAVIDNALVHDKTNLKLTKLLGLILFDLERLNEAKACFKRALINSPNDHAALFHLAQTCYFENSLQEAADCYIEFINLNPESAEAFNNLGNVKRKQDLSMEALELYDNAIRLNPEYADAYINKGIVFQEELRIEEALACYDYALGLDHERVDVLSKKGSALTDLGQLKEAIDTLEAGLKIVPDHVESLNNLGIAFKMLGDYREALKSFEQAILIRKNSPETYNNIGLLYQEMGKFEIAKLQFEQAILFDPYFAEAYRNLILIKDNKSDTEIVDKLKTLLITEHLTKLQKCEVHHALARVYEDKEDPNQALKHILEGNKIKSAVLSYDINDDKDIFENIKFKAQEFKANAPPYVENTDLLPIFIVGMPRSGTTLIEQIISSHSKVLGMGELPYVSRFGQGLVQKRDCVTPEELTKFKIDYLQAVREKSGHSYSFTDKMPHNFQYVGLILSSIPEAKVVHVKRDPIATCWSNFKQYFSVHGLGYSYDLEDTVNYYNLYSSLMKFWDDQYDDKIYNLDYEKLIISQEQETRSLVHFLGLEWESACLTPHKNERVVSTASQVQVRKSIYKDSSLQWQKFKPYLKGAFDGLLD